MDPYTVRIRAVYTSQGISLNSARRLVGDIPTSAAALSASPTAPYHPAPNQRIRFRIRIRIRIRTDLCGADLGPSIFSPLSLPPGQGWTLRP